MSGDELNAKECVGSILYVCKNNNWVLSSGECTGTSCVALDPGECLSELCSAGDEFAADCYDESLAMTLVAARDHYLLQCRSLQNLKGPVGDAARTYSKVHPDPAIDAVLEIAGPWITVLHHDYQVAVQKLPRPENKLPVN